MTKSTLAAGVKPQLETCRSIDWYSEGDERTIEVGGIRVIVRFIARKGRRARISIEGPTGARFDSRGGEFVASSTCPDLPRHTGDIHDCQST